MSKRFAALCCSPEMLRNVCVSSVSRLLEVRSLTCWFVRHGRHVRKLNIYFPPFDIWDHDDELDDWQYDERVLAPPAVAACLGAAGAGGSLVDLTVGGAPGSDWLAAFPSLRRLVLMEEDQQLLLSPAIEMLTNLESLTLVGQPISWSEDLRLPASITHLHLQDPGAFVLPDQVGAAWMVQITNSDGM